MTSSDGSNNLTTLSDDGRSLTPEVIRQHVRDRVMRRYTLKAHAPDHHESLKRRHTHNGHPGSRVWNRSDVVPPYEKRTNSIIRICVGGEEFITTHETIDKLLNSRLATMLEDDQHFNHELGVFFFDRSPEVFRAILDCHRYGQLHLPGHLCGNDLLAELQFWGITMDRVAKCCINKITVGRTEAEVYANVEYELSNEFEDLLIRSFREVGFEKTKMKTYLFLEYPSFSKMASRWSTFFAALIVLSTLNVALMSHQVGRQKKVDVNYTVDEHLLNLVNTSKWKKLWETDVNEHLLFFDLALVTLFTLEILIRFVTGPDKFLFFKSWINVIDVITILMYWSKFVLALVVKTMRDHEDMTKIEFTVFLFTELQFLRMFRILKLARNFTGLRVLILVLKNSRHELVTLIVFIIVGMFFFSFIIYVVEIHQQETFPNVLVAFWWSLVTMTTVGYGDYTPTGALGMLVGGLCAVSGMIISGLSIPILSNNFNIYYNTLEYQLRVHEDRIKELKSLEVEIRHAKNVTDLGSIEASLKRLEEIEMEEKNSHMRNGVHEVVNVKSDDSTVSDRANAMPQSGDVVYKSPYERKKKKNYSYEQKVDDVLTPEVAFKAGSWRRDVTTTPVNEVEVDLDDIFYDLDVVQHDSPLSSGGREAHHDDVIGADDVSNDVKSEPTHDAVQTPEQDEEEVTRHLKMIDDVTKDYDDQNVPESPPTDDVIESSYFGVGDPHESTTNSPEPPIPNISNEIFQTEMLRSDKSEQREFLI